MFVYSKKIIQFVEEIKQTIREILSREVGLKVTQGRFYDRKERSSYPIQVVIYNHKSQLGYFDPNFYELGFHEGLMHSNGKQRGDVIRHELAHYITFINYGEGVLPHGAEFKAFCQQMRWGEEVSKASSCLDEPAPLEESGILRKVQKLLSLATSRNQHEAELALSKSQQLLLKHNIDTRYVSDEEKIFLKRILKQKQATAKIRAIAKILETFFVSIVFHRGKGCIYLEIMGNKSNVEVAEYVAKVLQDELDNLWSLAQQNTSLRGLIAKNSFFLGLAKGYCNKVQALKKDYSSDMTHAVMVIEKQLIDAKELIYPRLSYTTRRTGHCSTSSALGEKMGRQLNINPACTHAPREGPSLINH